MVGSDTATFPEGNISVTTREPKAQDPMPPLARKMIVAGCDPEASVEIRRGAMRVWKKDHTLRFWADQDIRELPSGNIVWRKYQKFPDHLRERRSKPEPSAATAMRVHPQSPP